MKNKKEKVLIERLDKLFCNNNLKTIPSNRAGIENFIDSLFTEDSKINKDANLCPVNYEEIFRINASEKVTVIINYSIDSRNNIHEVHREKLLGNPNKASDGYLIGGYLYSSEHSHLQMIQVRNQDEQMMYV